MIIGKMKVFEAGKIVKHESVAEREVGLPAGFRALIVSGLWSYSTDSGLVQNTTGPGIYCEDHVLVG